MAGTLHSSTQLNASLQLWHCKLPWSGVGWVKTLLIWVVLCYYC